MTTLLDALGTAKEGTLALDIEIARTEGVLVLRHNQETGKNDEYTYWQYTRSLTDAVKFAEKTMRRCGHTMFEIHARIVHDSHGPWAGMEITVPSREFRGTAHGQDAEARALVEAALRARAAHDSTEER